MNGLKLRGLAKDTFCPDIWKLIPAATSTATPARISGAPELETVGSTLHSQGHERNSVSRGSATGDMDLEEENLPNCSEPDALRHGSC